MATASPRVALVDYGAGNLRSVAKALERSGLAVERDVGRGGAGARRRRRAAGRRRLRRRGREPAREGPRRRRARAPSTRAGPISGSASGSSSCSRTATSTASPRGLGWLARPRAALPRAGGGPAAARAAHRLERGALAGRATRCAQALPERDVYYFVHGWRALPESARRPGRELRLRRRRSPRPSRTRTCSPCSSTPRRARPPASACSTPSRRGCARAEARSALALGLARRRASGCVGTVVDAELSRRSTSGARRSCASRWRRSARSPRPPRSAAAGRGALPRRGARGSAASRWCRPKRSARELGGVGPAGRRARARGAGEEPVRRGRACCSARSRAGSSARAARPARSARPRWACASSSTARPRASGSGRASSTTRSRPLLENVLLTPRYPGGGTRWLTAEEFAQFAASELAAALPLAP